MCFNRHRCGTSSHSRRRWSEGRRRSNVESMFSMVKAKFRDSVMSKTDTAMKNEVLCKFLCHNICCLIMSQVELGIELVFWKNEGALQPTIA